jgi:hypothetical protein
LNGTSLKEREEYGAEGPGSAIGAHGHTEIGDGLLTPMRGQKVKVNYLDKAEV